MKPQKYIDKILNKAYKFLVEEGLFRYSVTGEVITESGIKNPYLVLTYPNNEVVRYNLREDYDIHEEEDVSISQSFAYIKRNILKDIREYNALRENESMNLEIESDELDEPVEYVEPVEHVEQTIPEYIHRDTPNIPDVYTLTNLDNLVGAVYKNANIPEEYVIKHAFGCDIVIEDSHRDNILVSKSLLTEEEIGHVLFDREYQIAPDVTESQGHFSARYQLRPLEPNEIASVRLSTPLSVFSDKTMRAVADMLGTNDFYIVCGTVAYKKGILSFDRAEFLQEACNSDEVYLNKILEYDFENHQLVECTRDEYEEEYNREQALNEAEEEIGQMINEVHELEDAVEDLNENSDENLDENGYFDDDDEEEEEDMDEDEYSESLSDSRKAAYFADYDTNYKSEFASTIVDFLKWQLPDERITVSDDTLSISGVDFSVDRLNHEYQTNSKDFYETGMDLVNNYKDICAENVREELCGHSEETTDNHQEDEEEYDEGYFPFE